MNAPEFFKSLPNELNLYAKYGLEFNVDGTLNGPKRPPLYGITPEINLSGKALSLAPNKSFLEEMFQKDSNYLIKDNERLMEVVGKVFTSATDKNIHDYSNFVFMDKQGWEKFKTRVKSNVQEGRNFDAVHLEGLVVLGAEGDHRMLPLLFHEAGHSLFLPSKNTFTDEFRAYYFQRVATEILHTQLQQLGIASKYPDYYEDDMFPSKEHKDAYLSAATLYVYQSLPQLQEQDNSGFSHRMQNLLSLIKPA